jgi:hypothetical protein
VNEHGGSQISAGNLAPERNRSEARDAGRSVSKPPKSALRGYMARLESELRTGMSRVEGGLRGEMAALRAELLGWAFLFWVGQIAGLAALMGLMLHRFPVR